MSAAGHVVDMAWYFQVPFLVPVAVLLALVV